jgi:Bacterial archaeo-eukaryotic release factor family 10
MKEARVTPHALTALAELRFRELALSAYLPTDRGAGHGYYRALLDDLVRPDLHELSGVERAALERELPIVLAALDKRRFACPAVAVFSCSPHGFLRFVRMGEPLPGRIAVAEELDLAPIRRQLFEHPPALVAVADKRHARLYALVLGELDEVASVEGLPIRRHRQRGGPGGRSAASLQRREDEHTRWNLAEVATAVTGLLEGDDYGRLVLAGPREARAQLRRLLAAPALSMLTNEGSVPMYASGNELAERLRRLDSQPAGGS